MKGFILGLIHRWSPSVASVRGSASPAVSAVTNPGELTSRDLKSELLASPQKMHAAVLAGFPSTGWPTDSEGPVLWRLDHHGHQAMLYLVSPTQP